MVAVAHRRWSFTRGSSMRLWLRTILVFWEGGPLWEVVAYRRWLHVEVSTVDTIQRSKKLWRVLAIHLFSLYVLPHSDHLMFSREFPFYIFINYAYICASMLCTRQHLKETVPWGTIMWSGKTKHTRQKGLLDEKADKTHLHPKVKYIFQSMLHKVLGEVIYSRF